MFCRKVEAFDSRMHLSHHCGRLNGSFSEGVGSPGYMDKVQKSDTFMIDELTIVGSFFWQIFNTHLHKRDNSYDFGRFLKSGTGKS